MAGKEDAATPTVKKRGKKKLSKAAKSFRWGRGSPKPGSPKPKSEAAADAALPSREEDKQAKPNQNRVSCRSTPWEGDKTNEEYAGQE